MMTKSELQQFTKEELICYISRIEFFLPSYPSIKECILEKRFDDVGMLINKNLKACSDLYTRYKNKQISNIDYLSQSMKLNDEWRRLDKKRDKIEKELYPREE